MKPCSPASRQPADHSSRIAIKEPIERLIVIADPFEDFCKSWIVPIVLIKCPHAFEE